MSDMSDYEDDHLSSAPSGAPGGSGYDPKRHAREQHNALERRRRDNIKDMYTSLREVVPDASGERVQASRAVILKKAIETIEKGQNDSATLAVEVAQCEAKNERMREEIARLKAKKQQQPQQKSALPMAPSVSEVAAQNFPNVSLFNHLNNHNQP